MPKLPFIPLLDYLRPKDELPSSDPAVHTLPEPTISTPLPDETRAVQSAAVFYAHVQDAIASVVPHLLSQLAYTVLGRELTTQRVDIEGILERLLRDYRNDAPLRIRVHPSCISELSCDVPILADDTLELDDCILELRDGQIDARFATRVNAVISMLQSVC